MLLAFVTPLATGVRTAAALHAGPAGLTWMLSAMSVGLAVALLTAGVLADDRGRRRVFVAGLVLLGAASAVAGAAGHPGVVIAARLVEGLGGAAVLAGGLGMIGHAYPTGPARARAAAIWGAAVGAGTGLGGIVAVVLDGAEGSWRVTYAATAVAALVLAVVARRLLPESVTTAPRPVDLAGVAAARRRDGCAAGRTRREPVGDALDVGGPARRRGRAARRLRGGAGPAARAADRPGPVPVARVRRRHRRCARRGDRGRRRRVLHADRAAARPRRRAAGGDGADAGVVRGRHGDGVAAPAGARDQRAACCSSVSLGVSAAGLLGSPCWPRGRRCGGCCPGSSSSAWATAARTPRWAARRSPTCRRPWPGWAAAPSNTARYLGSALGVTLAALLANPTAAPAALLSGFDETVLGAAALSAGGAVLVALLGGRTRLRQITGMSITSQPPWCSVDGVGQAGRRAQRAQVVEVEGADVAPGREWARPRRGRRRRRGGGRPGASRRAPGVEAAGQVFEQVDGEDGVGRRVRAGERPARCPARVVTGRAQRRRHAAEQPRGAGRRGRRPSPGGPRRRAGATGSRSSSPARRRAGRRRARRPGRARAPCRRWSRRAPRRSRSAARVLR